MSRIVVLMLSWMSLTAFGQRGELAQNRAMDRIDLQPTAVLFRYTVIGGAVSVHELAIQFKNVGNRTWNPQRQRRYLHADIGALAESVPTHRSLLPGQVMSLGLGMVDNIAPRHCSMQAVRIDQTRTAGQSGPGVFSNDRRKVLAIDVKNPRRCINPVDPVIGLTP